MVNEQDLDDQTAGSGLAADALEEERKMAEGTVDPGCDDMASAMKQDEQSEPSSPLVLPSESGFKT